MSIATHADTPDWLKQAIAAGHKTKWLSTWLHEYLPEMKDVQDTPEGHAAAQAWAERLQQQFVNRDLIFPKQQFQYRNSIANAIKSFDPHNPVLRYVQTTTEQWVDINNDRQNPGDRTTKFITNPDALVERAIALLRSSDWADVAAGLAVVVGRRIGEILISRFESKTDYSVVFSEPVKRGDEALPLSFEIPTLAPADQVLQAIDRLQAGLQIPQHKENEQPNILKRRINTQYSNRVAQMCDRHFQDLVPARTGEDNLYTHLFRAVYATIATHWYCPPTVPEIEFRAEIQGHFFLLNEQNPDRRRNTASQRNYWDYAIGDGNGNRNGRLGIKLGQPGVQVLEAFQHQHQHQSTPPSLPPQIRVIEMPNSPAFASVELDAPTINAIVHRAANLLISNHWAEMAVGLVLTTGRSIKTLRSAQFTTVSSRTLQFQASDQPEPIRFPTLLDAEPLLVSLAKFLKLSAPKQEDNAIEAVCHRQFAKLIALDDEIDLRAVYACITAYWYNADSDDETYWRSILVPPPKGYKPSSPERGIKLSESHSMAQPQQAIEEPTVEPVEIQSPQPATLAPARPRKRRLVELTIDVELVKQVAEQYGIPIRRSPDAQAQAVETLLNQLQQGRLTPSQATTPPPEPIPDRTITWFVDRIDSLEQQVKQLQTERDQAVEGYTQLQQDLTEAQAHIDQLQTRLQQLEQAQVALDHLRNLLPQMAHPQAKPAQTEARTQPSAPSPGGSVAIPPKEGTAIAIPQQNTRSAPLEDAAAAIPASTRQKPQTEKRNLVDTEAKIAYILDRIFAFNQSCDQPHQRWQISFPPVRELAKVLGADNQGAIKNLFDRQKEVIQQHHFNSGIISSRHNRQHNHSIADDIHLSLADFEQWHNQHSQQTQQLGGNSSRTYE
jgi:hypothetical protein